jgi:hypothetical protein
MLVYRKFIVRFSMYLLCLMEFSNFINPLFVISFEARLISIIDMLVFFLTNSVMYKALSSVRLFNRNPSLASVIVLFWHNASTSDSIPLSVILHRAKSIRKTDNDSVSDMNFASSSRPSFFILL